MFYFFAICTKGFLFFKSVTLLEFNTFMKSLKGSDNENNKNLEEQQNGDPFVQCGESKALKRK